MLKGDLLLVCAFLRTTVSCGGLFKRKSLHRRKCWVQGTGAKEEHEVKRGERVTPVQSMEKGMINVGWHGVQGKHTTAKKVHDHRQPNVVCEGSSCRPSECSTLRELRAGCGLIDPKGRILSTGVKLPRFPPSHYSANDETGTLLVENTSPSKKRKHNFV
ncbi:uncharacterized protein TEOVI_000587500 [Trypanosoma equiperdum]|uniref:Secreted protein n=2 Tax=Trypanozoon TaxID=39700 RepID=Q38BU0_TRYB2|nr:hypothetical protein Tb10.70.4480 [Trypanosoma brucei brucei TREU927]EAN77730.1 hypothetical protein Tb10.70.4480 [Trypanosoma brucei brucei TREU927]SCU66650.1 hypothetical protein, conserved [Trypanosoma equiperdum]